MAADYEILYANLRDFYLSFNGKPMKIDELLEKCKVASKSTIKYRLERLVFARFLKKELVKRIAIYTPIVKDFTFEEYAEALQIDPDQSANIKGKLRKNKPTIKGARVITADTIVAEHKRRGLKDPYVLQSQNRRDELKNKRAKISIGSSLA